LGTDKLSYNDWKKCTLGVQNRQLLHSLHTDHVDAY